MSITYTQLRRAIMKETTIGYGPKNGVYTSSSRAVDSVTLPELVNSLKPSAATSHLWIFLPDNATAANREKPAGQITPSTGLVENMGANYSGAEANPETVELLRWLSPTELFNAVEQALKTLPQNGLWPLGAFTDSDMDDSGVTNWTRVNLDNAASIKVTTAANVESGRRALRTLLNAANGYAAGGAVRVNPGQQIFVSAVGRTAVGTGVLILHDTTNDAEIARIEYTGSRFADLELSCTAPATCKSVEVRLGGLASADDAYWDHVCGPMQPGSDYNLLAPSWLNEEWRLRKLREARYLGTELTTAGSAGRLARDARSRTFQDWGGKEEVIFHAMHGAANPYSLQLRKTPPAAGLWVEGMHNALDFMSPALSNDADGESAATAMPERLVVLTCAVAVCERVQDLGLGDEGLRKAHGRLQRELSTYLASTPVETGSQKTDVYATFSRV